MRSDDIYVHLKYGNVGLMEQFSLDDRIARAEHDAGLLEIGRRGRSSHCWLCRKDWERQKDEDEAAHRRWQ